MGPVRGNRPAGSMGALVVVAAALGVAVGACGGDGAGGAAGVDGTGAPETESASAATPAALRSAAAVLSVAGIPIPVWTSTGQHTTCGHTRG